MIAHMSKDILTRYAKAGKDFLATANSASASQLAKSPAPGEWSAAFVIHHMADAEAHFATRYLHILAETKPALALFDEDAYPEVLHYAERKVGASLEVFTGLHSMVEDVLGNISDEQWARAGVHPQKGELRLSQVLEVAAGHLEGHLNQLREVLSGN